MKLACSLLNNYEKKINDLENSNKILRKEAFLGTPDKQPGRGDRNPCLEPESGPPRENSNKQEHFVNVRTTYTVEQEVFQLREGLRNGRWSN